MTRRLGTLEAAFEMASSGGFASMPELERALRSAGYEKVSMHLAGAFTREQLRKLCAGSRAAQRPLPQEA